MKTLNVLLMTFGLAIFAGSTVSAQDNPGDDLAVSLSRPTIATIEFPGEMSSRRVHAVSTANEKYVGTDYKGAIDIQRGASAPGKLFIKGRGTLNHVRIFQVDDASGFPVLDHTFRGVNYEEIDIAALPDGDYVIQYVSPHQAVEFSLHLTGTGAN